MDTSKATARPWRAADVHAPRRMGGVVVSDSGTVAASPGTTGYANAALIVRAVNSHEAVVAALRDLLDGSEPWDVRATQARAALALAEQGGG